MSKFDHPIELLIDLFEIKRGGQVTTDNLKLLTTNSTVDMGAVLTADGAGYDGSQGIGRGATQYGNTRGSTGGAHGGRGSSPLSGLETSIAYDDYTNPTMHGSGGGNGGNGGGIFF